MTQAQHAIPVSLQSGVVETTYRFRKKEGETSPRPALELKVPVPSIEDLHTLLSPDFADRDELKKVRRTVLEAVQGLVVSAVKTRVDDDIEFDQDKMDEQAGQVNLYTLANLPRDRRNTISKDDIDAFNRFYIDTAPTMEALGVSVKAAENLAELFAKRLRTVANNPEFLAKVQERLVNFVEGVEDEALLAEHESVINYLMDRCTDGLDAQIELDDI